MSVLTIMKSQFIIPVIRENDPETLEQICLSLIQAGLNVLELTLMSEAAYSVIKTMSSRNNLTVGAGTVLNVEQARRAVDHGAKFLISPGLNLDVVAFARKNHVPIFPGVLTPTEIMQAKEAGCENLKLFPINALGGPAYLTALKGPFPHLNWMPSGGVSLENINAYRAAGAICVGIGGRLLPADVILRKDWTALTKIATEHARAAAE